MACESCREAKVKCVSKDKKGDGACVRCSRLSLECVPHVSRQGQGPKRRKTRAQARENTIEAEVLEQTSKLGSKHYGLHFVIRHWVSIAMTRRSFSLLDRASSLACRCGIKMDQVFCGESDFPVAAMSIDGNRAMSFLPEMILKPSREQEDLGTPLLLTDVPNDMLQAIECLPTATRSPETRWIIIREMKCGVSRYYVSTAMQRDIASLALVQDTWKANEKEVNDLWLPKEEKPKFSRGFNQQIAIHKDPFTQPKPTSIKNTKICLSDGNTVKVDCCLCLKLVNLDQAFLSIEYYSSESQEVASPSSGRGAASKRRRQSEPGEQLFADMTFLDSMLDELEATGELDELMSGFEF